MTFPEHASEEGEHAPVSKSLFAFMVVKATGDFFVGSTTDSTIFRSNVAEQGEEAEVFLEPTDDGRTIAVSIR